MKNMEQKILKEENEHLKDTVDRLINAKEKLDQSMLAMGKENLEMLKDLRADPETNGADFFFFLESLHEKNLAFNFKDKYKKVEELDSLMKEPYFARIDLRDLTNSEKEIFYIGKFGYTEDKPIVTDWRAKVASVYYRYRFPQNNINYETPEGKVLRDLLLKRTFEIDNGSLIKYYNNDIQLDEKEIITEKISKRTGGVLEDIVETIQESQLDIIEADPRQICIVQGCVGSGKSTVAIHKLSHIFFNFPNVIHPERAILIAKNQILVGYLSTLFPKLGIFDINYKSLRELIYTIVIREDLKLNIDFDTKTNLSVFDLTEIRKLEQKLDNIHKDYEDQLINLISDDEYSSYVSYKYNRKIPVYENYSEVIDDLEEEIKMESDFIKENPGSAREWLYKENIKTIKKLNSHLKRIRINIKEKTLAELSKEMNLPFQDKMGYLDTLIYLFIYADLAGFSKMSKYEYCVVDEGQDFGLLEYHILGKLVLNGRLCILGDLNQSYSNEGLVNWSEISEVIKDARNAQTFTLDTNYRSTKPIIDLANKIISPYTNNYLPKSINRKGNEPSIIITETYENQISLFKDQINEDLKKLDKSVGVICFDPETFENAQKIIKNKKINTERVITLNSKEKISYIPKGLYLTMFEDCKGLEFAKVYVLDLNLNRIDSFKNAKKAFIAVTRAMNDLIIISNNERPGI
ncbi:hypothetical protein A3F07_03710 [candidate division WWE3 bacterium RIFCSPHIGHO2_12_FULL_38_15]|uniref:DNA 3'-5' helicase n=1 Tax=candidate division WWE3 bacterium RIFCSPHIGHO2_02_FULL_38_14 TaxID=1802620 RepID=A0A1F4V9A0_UNCKA|nr:MAG: hypothetical protein A2793_02270 [candidate division WWE3 bacterium RIFCSPHIGHO2_01_FULL_38_45]OGC48927.1 MAG: hypothetical protein A3F07_03710 [candidate division WWE3 bacterium RIFCSPHIGHO2_12_FULL_38_15]OGC52966.1 MAG: hypothetical protein A3B64_04895 [candidate division WWE3 bacterium RIFCSPLOWO2_01_FULL_37_24]OGC53233.1 MAG: hypothetical protein A3D91_02305 [candidate division WWE3 bacterium RIFCSPHIGHO2_02_FULL_38_14]